MQGICAGAGRGARRLCAEAPVLRRRRDIIRVYLKPLKQLPVVMLKMRLLSNMQECYKSKASDQHVTIASRRHCALCLYRSSSSSITAGAASLLG